MDDLPLIGGAEGNGAWGLDVTPERAEEIASEIMREPETGRTGGPGPSGWDHTRDSGPAAVAHKRRNLDGVPDGYGDPRGRHGRLQ